MKGVVNRLDQLAKMADAVTEAGIQMMEAAATHHTARSKMGSPWAPRPGTAIREVRNGDDRNTPPGSQRMAHAGDRRTDHAAEGPRPPWEIGDCPDPGRGGRRCPRRSRPGAHPRGLLRSVHGEYVVLHGGQRQMHESPRLESEFLSAWDVWMRQLGRAGLDVDLLERPAALCRLLRRVQQRSALHLHRRCAVLLPSSGLHERVLQRLSESAH